MTKLGCLWHKMNYAHLCVSPVSYDEKTYKIQTSSCFLNFKKS